MNCSNKALRSTFLETGYILVRNNAEPPPTLGAVISWNTWNLWKFWDPFRPPQHLLYTVKEAPKKSVEDYKQILEKLSWDNGPDLSATSKESLQTSLFNISSDVQITSKAIKSMKITSKNVQSVELNAEISIPAMGAEIESKHAFAFLED